MNSSVRIGPAAASPRRSRRCHWRPRSRPPAGRPAAPEGTDGRPDQRWSGPEFGQERSAGRAPDGGRTDGSKASGGRVSEARAARRDGEMRALEAADIGGHSGAVSAGRDRPGSRPAEGAGTPLGANLRSRIGTSRRAFWAPAAHPPGKCRRAREGCISNTLLKAWEKEGASAKPTAAAISAMPRWL